MSGLEGKGGGLGSGEGEEREGRGWERRDGRVRKGKEIN